jgi:hypothetical protein
MQDAAATWARERSRLHKLCESLAPWDFGVHESCIGIQFFNFSDFHGNINCWHEIFRTDLSPQHFPKERKITLQYEGIGYIFVLKWPHAGNNPNYLNVHYITTCDKVC